MLIDDDDRYSRLRLIQWWDQDKLSAAKVLVVGAGALGNEVLKNLALLGIGWVYVVDFDCIEQSNLARAVLFRSADRGQPKATAAAAALREINPDTRVHALVANVITDIGLGLFQHVDVVIGCLDNREARLWVNRQCWKVNTPWIDGGIQEISGVVKVFVPPHSACYECGMTENDYRLINLRYSCPLLRNEDLLAGKVPTAPTISSIVGGFQTQEAVKLLHGIPVQPGTASVYNGAANQFYTTHFQRREECLSHETYPTPLELPLSVDRDSVEDLFACLRERHGVDGIVSLHLDRDLVVSLDCSKCNAHHTVLQPLQLVGMDRAHCRDCGQLTKPRLQHSIAPASELSKQKLGAVGVPPRDMIRVETEEEEIVCLLTGDKLPHE